MSRLGWSSRLGAGLGIWILVAIAAALWNAAPARAAFPGRNGLLAVQPVSGDGLVIATDSGAGAHRICSTVCGRSARAQWSPDGRSLVVNAAGDAARPIDLVAADGSCIDCLFGTADSPAFDPDGQTVSVLTADHRLSTKGIDGLATGGGFSLRDGGETPASATWSAGGELAVVVAGGRIWIDDRSGSGHSIGAGHSPSWSPDGSELALVRAGWIWLVNGRTGRGRRLVHGIAPAFSPDGRWVAFIGADDRVEKVRSGGGSPLDIGNLTGRSVDWQPLPAAPVAAPVCTAPTGSTTLVSGEASVYAHRVGEHLAVMSCDAPQGLVRVLEKFTSSAENEVFDDVSLPTTNGHFVAVLNEDGGHYGSEESVDVFDATTGLSDTTPATIRLAHQYSSGPAITALAVGSNGDYAVAETGNEGWAEEILESTPAGITQLAGLTTAQLDGQSGITDLSATGTTLSWTENGTPQTAQLS